MLAWIAAFLFAFGALSDGEGITPSSSLLSWPVLVCSGMALLALDQAIRQGDRNKVKSGNEEKEEPG
jgi:hypothetical protein